MIATGAKQWETRSWATHYRGELLICAAKGGLFKKDLYDYLSSEGFQRGLKSIINDGAKNVFQHHLNFGKAVAIVKLTDCIRTEEARKVITFQEQDYGNYDSLRFAWKLENTQRIKNPFPVKGSQGFFNVELPEGIELINV